MNLKPEELIREAMRANPMEPKDYMRICFAMIDVADEVRFLPDFLFSIGAHIEHTYSKYCGKRCVRSVDGKEI